LATGKKDVLTRLLAITVTPLACLGPGKLLSKIKPICLKLSFHQL